MEKVLSKNRSFIMGMAILWVAFYHLPLEEGKNVFLWFVNEIGYGGVDIFIFLSGFGLFHSLNKNSDLTEYMSKRLKRLLPTYIPFIIVWMIVRKVTYQLYFTEVFGNLTMTGWWNQDSNQFNWYVDGIIVLYILAPFIYGYIKKSKNQTITILILFSIAMGISFGFFHGKLLIAVSRLPLFILGIGIASLMDKNSTEAKSDNDGNNKSQFSLIFGITGIVIWNILMIIGLAMAYYFMKLQVRFDLWHYGLWWYPFLLVAPGMSLDLGFLGDFLSKYKPTQLLVKLISAFGNASFEIFLIHIFIFETAEAKWIKGTGIWTLFFLLSFALGYGYYYLVNRKLLPLLCHRKLK